MHIRQQTLHDISTCLNENGCNYSVFLRAYTTPRRARSVSSQLIADALARADVVVDEIRAVSAIEAISETRSCLTYVGSQADGPDPASLRSAHFTNALAALASQIESAAHRAISVETFRLASGHPAYPVFWDFGLLITGANEAEMLIGSSSD